MKYSYLRHKPKLELALFVLTAGLLAYFGNTGQWIAFWPTLVVGVGLEALLLYVDSRSFADRLEGLRTAEFHLATQLESCGAIDIFLMADHEDQARRNAATMKIIENGRDFSLVTLTAASYIDPAVDRHWETLKARLDDGANLRLLLQDPFGAEKAVRDQRNRPDVPVETKLDLSAVLTLASAYDRVRVRFTEKNIYAAIFFSESQLTYDPYQLGLRGQRIENRFITILYKRFAATRPELDHAALLVDHFRYLWDEHSQPISEYLATKAAEIEENYGLRVAEAARDFVAPRSEAGGTG